MQGEYRGDFTRDTFHQANHFCRVLMQQGRVQLDADGNEQTSILLHYLRSLGGDLIGRHGGPAGVAAGGFAITSLTSNHQIDLQIGPGHYYVDGILCETGSASVTGGANPAGPTYLTQPDLPAPPSNLSAPGTMLAYLDVWERHVTSVQQERLREVALGGPDTASRAKIVWQVKLLSPGQALPAVFQNVFNTLDGQIKPGAGKTVVYNIPDAIWQPCSELWQPANRGLLKAQVQPQQMSTDPCVTSPMSSYRGTENQLYRVEIHNGGSLSPTVAPQIAVSTHGVDASAGSSVATAPAGPSFKWSRENGSVIFPILKLATSGGQTTVTLASLGRDSTLSLQVNDWVEVTDDNHALTGTVDPLLPVQAIDPINRVVTLGGTSAIIVDQPSALHPILRRWDGIGAIAESTGSLPANWLALEDGVQIQFQPPASTDAPATPYRSGDYWLIPARVATGGIEWPQQTDSQGNTGPAALPPHGIEHHYAPLAYVSIRSAANGGTSVVDLRRTFSPLGGS